LIVKPGAKAPKDKSRDSSAKGARHGRTVAEEIKNTKRTTAGLGIPGGKEQWSFPVRELL